MTSQLGYTPVSVDPYPPYFNITKTDTGYRIIVRRQCVQDDHGVIEGNIADIVIPEHFAYELFAFLGETLEHVESLND